MKKHFLAAFILASFVTDAQVKQGTIIYERKTDVHRRMQDEQMKAMIPQFQTSQNELFFRNDISVFKKVEEDNAPDPFNTGGGGMVVIKIGGPGENGILYKDHSTQKLLQQTELADKNYIIEDSIQTLSWKLVDETKTVLNHVCKKAIAKTERGSDVIAWYTEDISEPVGPDRFGGLPGAILLVDVNNGEMMYTATDIKTEVDDKELEQPSKGKHITRAEFDKKLDEVFGPATPDGRRMITRQN